MTRRFNLELLRRAQTVRPAGYYADLLATGRIVGEQLELTEADYLALREKYRAAQPPSKWPVWARAIARLKVAEDVGVGDTLERVIGPVGGAAFKSWFRRTFGVACGCAHRQQKLNDNFRY